jgi:hypothetical protein
MPEGSGGIPNMLAEGFAKVFAEFVAAVEDAVTDAELLGLATDPAALRSWQEKALPILRRHNAGIQEALARFQIGDAGPILVWAERERGLAKDLDGFPLTFAGPDHAQKLDFLETRVVTVAYQLCSTAGIP